MSKIIVPQELQEKIINLYVNKQYGLGRIKKELNIPFSPAVIKRVLVEHNIHIRTYAEAKVGNPKIEVPQELQNKIIDLYEQGYGLSRIVEVLQLTFSFDKVRSILQENNVHIRNCKEASQVCIRPELRKYPVNDNYPIESHNGAWLLGFFAVDGYLPISKGAKNRLTITLARKDEDVLHLIAKEIGFQGPIGQYIRTLDNKDFEISTLAFNSNKIRRTMESYGIVNDKTFKLHDLPSLPKEYLIDFIKGYFDGDGCVLEPKDKKIRMSICSANRDFLEKIQAFLKQEYDISGWISPDHNIWDLSFGVESSFRLGELFYNNDYIALPRKKNHYLQIREKYDYKKYLIEK